MKVVIQIPCFNEAQTLPPVLQEVPRQIEGVDQVEVLVIDDGSSDDTRGVALAHGADRVVRHRGNKGLARTFLTGLETALEMGADIIVNTDGDNQYPGANIPELIGPILNGEADLVIGDRQTQTDPKVPPGKRLFYRMGGFVMRTATGMEVHDAPSGFRAMSREFAMSIYLTNPFSYTMETIYAAAENRFAVAEVPITTNPKTRESRLFQGIVQYMRRSGSIILQGYSMHNPLRAFGMLSAPFMLLGLGLGMRFLYFFIQDPSDSGHIQSLILAAISILVGVQVFIFGMLGALVRANRLLLQDIRSRVRRMELSEGMKSPTPKAD